MAKPDMLYNGTILEWFGHAKFNASSGLPGHQNSSEQAVKDHGPVPDGLYSFPLYLAKHDAKMVKPGVLDVEHGVQRLPAQWTLGKTTYDNLAWGPDRVRLVIHQIDKPKARNRNGFYLHDSTKGYSHGCIEVDPMFFVRIREFIKVPRSKRGGKERLYLRVKYSGDNVSTYGGTKVSAATWAESTAG